MSEKPPQTSRRLWRGAGIGVIIAGFLALIAVVLIRREADKAREHQKPIDQMEFEALWRELVQAARMQGAIDADDPPDRQSKIKAIDTVIATTKERLEAFFDKYPEEFTDQNPRPNLADHVRLVREAAEFDHLRNELNKTADELGALDAEPETPDREKYLAAGSARFERITKRIGAIVAEHPTWYPAELDNITQQAREIRASAAKGKRLLPRP